MENKRLIIISHILRFPNGTGAASRVANYAIGLSRIGIPATVLCLKPYESLEHKVLNPDCHGYIGLTEYLYTTGTSYMRNNKVMRMIQNVQGLIGAVKYIIKIKRKEGILAILYYGIGNSIFYSFFGFILSKISRAIYIGESTEEPFVYFKNSFSRELNKYIFWNYITELFDGIIVISRYLQKRFIFYVRKNIPVEIIPIMVDTEKYKVLYDCHNNWVTYCGAFDHAEEIDLLLPSWAAVIKQYPDHKLIIIGDKTDKFMSKIYAKIDQLGIKESVVFTGFIPASDLPQFLVYSKVLLLPRFKGVFSLAGLPNKLGEYLASGRPVISTKVGDISCYVKDRKEAFLVEPGNIYKFGDVIKWVLENYSEAIKVGKEGQKVAQKYFNLENNCKKLFSFILDINNKRK